MQRPRAVPILAAAAVLVGLAGCSLPGADPYASAIDRSDLVTTTPEGSGELDEIRWNLPYEPFSIDALRSFNYAENTVIANLCESMLRLTPDLEIEPGLAERVDEPDELTQVYTLRSDVEFWDGTEMTADDVAYSLNRQLDPDNGSYFASYYAKVASIEATAPLEVTVRFTEPDALFEQAMATAAGAVSERTFTEQAGEAFGTPQVGVMCTGPFEFGEWSPGRDLVIERNDRYWDAALRPHADRVEFSFISDESTAVNALRAGEIDGQYFYLPPAGLIQLQKDDSLTLDYGESLVFLALIGASETGPMADVRVRRALSSIIDRTAISNVVLQGAALPSPMLAGPDYWGYEPGVFAAAAEDFDVDTDIERARQLLEEAGPQEPIVIAIQGSSAVHEQTANVIQAAGRELGLDIRTKVIPVEQFGNLYNDPTAREGLDAFFTTWYGNFPDPLEAYTMFVDDGYNNYGGYDDVSRLVQEAVSTLDPADRAERVVEIQDAVTRDAPWISLATLPTILVQNAEVSGATASMAYLYYPWAATVGGEESSR
ncbi:ABC transporter substrate-binding protein [Agromyces sp. NPDC058110]|uniref:ABC transporter substrate-binding protein n=1 Tax=Agromyces sp. NPDC058110 TaxID=3346345 RepID=UPI0036DEC072